MAALIILIVFIALVASIKVPEVSPIPVRPAKAEPRARVQDPYRDRPYTSAK